MAPLRLEVTGQATIYHPAERAVVSISIRSEGEAPETVIQDVTSDSEKVRAMLSELATKDNKGEPAATAAITHWSNSSISTGSYTRYNDDNTSRRVHEASMTFSAKFSNFQKLGACTTQLSTLGHVSITDIDWRLTSITKHSLTGTCRKQAVLDAVDKARDYARALGREAPLVTEVRDADGGGGYPVQAQMVYSRRGGGASPDVSFAPEDVALNCSVTVICEEK